MRLMKKYVEIVGIAAGILASFETCNSWMIPRKW